MDRKTAAYLKYSKNGKAEAERKSQEQEAALARWRANDPDQLAALARGSAMITAQNRADMLRHVEAGAFTPEAAWSHAWCGDGT